MLDEGLNEQAIDDHEKHGDQLAVDTYTNVHFLRDTGNVLSLAWTLDERQFLNCDVTGKIGELLESESIDLRQVLTYPVQDPYGSEAIRSAVRRHFNLDDMPIDIKVGAGVGSLLHALSRLGSSGTIGVLGSVYPDFPYWVKRAGGRCIPVTIESVSSNESRLSGLFFERPGTLHAISLSDKQILEACHEMGRSGGFVLIDEANANYCPPSESAVKLTRHSVNLIVLRGLSKGYGLGGLRLGVAISSAPMHQRLIGVIPPLQVSTLSLAIGRMVLSLGDVAEPLRCRIQHQKRRVETALREHCLCGTLSSPGELPYVFFDDEHHPSVQKLLAKGVVGKKHAFWRDSPMARVHAYRISVPLSETRWTELQRRLAESAD